MKVMLALGFQAGFFLPHIDIALLQVGIQELQLRSLRLDRIYRLACANTRLEYEQPLFHCERMICRISSSRPSGITGERKDSIWSARASASGTPRERM